MGQRFQRITGKKELFQKIFETRTIQELDALAEEILTCCIGYFQKREKGYSANVEKAMEFIRVNYGKDLSIDDVAASVFLSSGYLSIIFKEETGYTVLEYITAIRMSKAKELVLQGPGLKVKEIAERWDIIMCRALSGILRSTMEKHRWHIGRMQMESKHPDIRRMEQLLR